MRTIEKMLAEKAKQPKRRLLTFKEFCQYIYEPAQMLKKLNLPESEKREVEDAIEKLRS